MSEESPATAPQRLRDGGYGVLESVLPLDWVEELRAGFDKELLGVRAGRPAEVAKANGHYGTQARICLRSTNPLAIENPIALRILEAALGPKLFSYLPSGCNTRWPGSGYQEDPWRHAPFFPGTPLVLPISLAVVNTPLAEFTIENRATTCRTRRTCSTP